MTEVFRYAVIAALLMLPPVAGADPMQDVCHLRAKRESGHDGLRPMIGRVGDVTMRLSGSIAVGIGHNSHSDASPKSPAFAGSAATERREDKALARYLRVYDRCTGTAYNSGENSRASGAP